MQQKSKFIRLQQAPTKTRRLSELQWQYLINTTKALAEKEPKQHVRTRFILSALYSLYLRISELDAC